MKIYDISIPIHSNMIVYKNKETKRPKFEVISDFTNNSHYETKIIFDLHTGTHIDAPLHMIENGNTIKEYQLKNFITKCKVLEFKNIKKITKTDLVSKDINKGDFILLKTFNSLQDHFDFNFIFLDESGASFLADKEIIGVGIDALGIERNQDNHPTHKILLSKNIIIIEGLRLKGIEEGNYQLIALPLSIEGVEASPTRAILIE